MKKAIIITGIGLLTFLLYSCNSNSENQRERPGGFGGEQTTSVEVTPVQTETISDQIRAFGTIKAQDIVSITPQVSNRVTEIFVDLGDQVSQGDLLAKIYDVPFRDAVEQAQAQIRQARATLERDSTQFSRQEELFNRELISRSEYDDARSTYLNSRALYESARASLTQSREDLANTEIRSPVGGVVLERLIAEGDVATTGQAAFEIANLIGFETRVFLPLQDWELVQIGQDVSLRFSSRGDEIAQGVVSRISPRLDARTGLGEVVITLTETASSVHQGALVQSLINLETRENTIVIPRSALVERVDTYIEPETGTIELDRSYSAFVNQGDTVAVRRQLTLGIEQGDKIEVLEGLEAGEGLVITGQNNLEDGGKIRVAGSETAERQRPENVNPDQRQRSQQGRPGNQ